MSDVVITSLQAFFKDFEKNGVAKFPHENVALLVQQIMAVAERLAEVSDLPRDTPLQVLTGFTKCSVPEFAEPFKLMLNTERVKQMSSYAGSHSDQACLSTLRKLCLLASNSFNSLNVSNQWNIPANHRHGMSKGKGPCDNCGGCVNIYVLLTIHILLTMTTALTVKEEIRILKLECISDIDRALAHNIDPLLT